jgi:hypothetical protein
LMDDAAAVDRLHAVPLQRPAAAVPASAEQHAQRAGRSRAAHAATVAGGTFVRFGRCLWAQEDHARWRFVWHGFHSLRRRQPGLSAKQQAGRRPIACPDAVLHGDRVPHQRSSGPSRPLAGQFADARRVASPPTGKAGAAEG